MSLAYDYYFANTNVEFCCMRMYNTVWKGCITLCHLNDPSNMVLKSRYDGKYYKIQHNWSTLF
jgi:hypothetical protein